jgi:uncharacterized membrane protein YeaQ/YmgE (transglycosylase-associated protein family)
MGVITWVLTGGLVGWAACVVMGTPTREAFVFNALVATVGAAVGLWTLGGRFDVTPGLNVFAVIVGAACGAVVLSVVHFLRRGMTE